MREISVSEITKNISEMCIEANHFLSPDMKKVFEDSLCEKHDCQFLLGLPLLWD